MTQQLVECIPNYSEARRPEVVDVIVKSITSVPGVSVLDRHSDLDHNRTVITMVGTPEGVSEAAFRSIQKAKELIDLNQHEGAHPRIGATDVVPFVPIAEITMIECVELARKLGKRVGEELAIPVYLYEEAATKPERQNLENIRRGQYEGLKEEIQTNSDRQPDYGPAKLDSAGATVIGARAPLIAFNVYLNSTDINVAQKVAKAVRNSSGGLRYVKAMGVMVDGMAQVSMNLTNFRQTPIARVFEMVKREVQRYGVYIHHSELVGLIPQAALVDAAVWYTQMDQFDPQQVLESRLYRGVNEQNQPEGSNAFSFLSELASEHPTPGGGSAAAFTAAEGAALVSMVGRVTVGKKKYAQVEDKMWAMIEAAETLRAELTSCVDADAQAFNNYLKAIHMPKDTEEEVDKRNITMQQATLIAASVPNKVASLAFHVTELALVAAELGNVNAISDAASAAHLGMAAVNCAGLNVMINLKSLQDPTQGTELAADVKTNKIEIEKLEERLMLIIDKRAGL